MRSARAGLIVALLGACTQDQAREVRWAAHRTSDSSPAQAAARVQPDVSWMNLKFAKLQLGPGEKSSVQLEATNTGKEPTGPFRVAVYASPGASLTANRMLLGAVPVESLGDRGQRRVHVPFTAPAQPGGYAVGIEVDDLQQVPNDNRLNNRSGASQLIVK